MTEPKSFEERADESLSAILKASEEQGKRLEDTGKKLSDLKVMVDEHTGKIKTTEEVMGDLVRRFEAKRHGLQYGDSVLAAIPDRYRKHIRLAEIMNAQYKTDKSHCAFPDDAPMKVAMGLWLQGTLLRLTDPGKFMKRQEEFDKLETAMQHGPQEKVALQEDTATEGQEFVPTVIEAEILRLVADNSIMRPKVRKIPMTTKIHQFPIRANAFSAAIIAEEGTITDSVPGSPFTSANLTAKKIAAFATVSSELMQDNVVGLADYLAMEFTEQIGRTEDFQSLEGDGTGVNFTGVVAASGVASVSSGANGDGMYWTKLVDAIYGDPSGTAKEQAALVAGEIFMSPKTWSQIIRTRVDAAAAADRAGGLLLTMPGPAGSRIPASILGFPVNPHSAILTNRATGTGTNRTNVYFGPPQTIIFGDLLGFQIGLNPWAKFSTFQIDIRGLKRTGILVGVPSAWSKYIAIDATLVMKP